MSKAAVYDALVRSYPSAGRLGGVREIRVASRTDYGRARMIVVNKI